MRQAGKLPTEQEARHFVDYLLTKEMPARAEAENGEFAIWINEEDHLAEARRELDTFRSEPQHERYQSASRKANAIRSSAIKEVAEVQKRVTDMRSQWSRPASSSKPLTIALIVISVIVFLLSGQGNFNSVATQTLMFANPLHFVQVTGQGLDATQLDNKLVDIRQGQVWRTVTPIFLHANFMHIGFNMLLMYQLGGLIEPRIGTPRYGLLVLITAFASVTITCLMPFRLVLPIEFGTSTPFLLGMSGVVFGLIGYLWARTLTDPMFGMMIRPTIFLFAVAYIAVGISGVLDSLLGNISNWGHLLGLVFGFAMAMAETLVAKKK